MGCRIDFPEPKAQECHNPGRRLCPAAPYPCAAPCSVPAPQQPNKGSIIFSLSRGNGGGGRNEIKVLAVEIVNLGLETAEAAGERRERECGLWVTLNIFSQGRVLCKC